MFSFILLQFKAAFSSHISLSALSSEDFVALFPANSTSLEKSEYGLGK